MADAESIDPEALAEVHHEERAERDQSVARDLDQAHRLVEALGSDEPSGDPTATD
jgi:hypothetical protein